MKSEREENEMAKNKVGNAKFLEVIKVLDLKQEVVIIDVSEPKNEISKTVYELIYGLGLEKFRVDDEVESLILKNNKIYIYVDILKGRMIERNGK